MRQELIELLLTLTGGVLFASALSAEPFDALPPPLLAGATLLGGLVVLSQRPNPLTDLSGQLQTTAVTALATLLLLLTGALQPGNSTALLAQVGAVTVLMFAISGLNRLLCHAGWDQPVAALAVAGLLVLLATLPLWLGPAIDRSALPQALIDTLVAVNPVSYLAAWQPWDYLRGDWFYRHSPLGSLRYDYPSPLPATLVWLLIGALPSLRRNGLSAASTTPSHHQPTGEPSK